MPSIRKTFRSLINIPKTYYISFRDNLNVKEWCDHSREPIKWAKKHYHYKSFFDTDYGATKDLGSRILGIHRENSCISTPNSSIEAIRKCIFKDFPKSAIESIRRADLVCEGVFTLLGVGPYRFEKDIDWSSNLMGMSWTKGTRRELAEKIYKGFPHNGYVIGDLKVPWELNKHLFFFDLARAYVLTGDDKYARKFRNLIESWWNENPCSMNLAWNEPLIVAQRAISWIFAMRLMILSSVIEGDFYLRYMASLYDHLEWIQYHYELFEKSSNHLIGNLAGVLVITAAYPEFDISKDSEAKGLGILVDQLKKQVYPDGIQYEQSVSYHRYILEFIYSIILQFKHARKEVHREVIRVAEKMAEYIMCIISPKGIANLISDADGAYVYKFDTNDINDYRPHLALGSHLFKRADFVNQSRGQNEVVVWMLGPGTYIKEETIPERKSIFFKEGGVIVMRSGWQIDSVQMTFDCGNIGMGYNDDLPHGTHGHDDLLSFTLSCYGEQMLVDKGSGNYTGDLNIHDALRLSMSHNTFSLSPPASNPIEARAMKVESHSIPIGPWTLEKRASPIGMCFMICDGLEYTSASHNGYRRFPNAPTHKRHVFYFPPNIFIIVDHIFSKFSGTWYHKVLMPFHFAPGVKIDFDEKHGIALLEKACIHYAVTSMDDSWKTKIYEGCKEPYSGWFAKDYGFCVPAPTVNHECITILPFSAGILLDCRSSANKETNVSIEWIGGKGVKSRCETLLAVSDENRFVISFFPESKNPLLGEMVLPENAEIAVAKFGADVIEKAWVITDKDLIKVN